MAQLSPKYAQVAKDIAAILKKPDWDDGSLGPLFVRLAWHCSGTYDAKSGTGGSDGGRIRFPPELTDGANAGLKHAMQFLEGIKQRRPWVSYSDLYTLAGCVAIEAMGGPSIPWHPGRIDVVEEEVKKAPIANGRLPDGAKGSQHLRDVFYRMGFDDREIVALSGAHALGRCHTDRSGFDGPWTYTPTRFSNQYFILLLSVTWTPRKWNGPLQYQNPDGDLMMLPSDIALIEDPKFKVWVEKYAKDKDLFFQDFSAAFAKLISLGKNGQVRSKL